MLAEKYLPCRGSMGYHRSSWPPKSVFPSKLFLNGKVAFPIVKDTTPQTHAYTTSKTNFGGTPYEKTNFL